MAKLKIWASTSSYDCNLYANLADFCQLAGIEPDPEELVKHFGIGQLGNGTLLIQADGIAWFIKHYPAIAEALA